MKNYIKGILFLVGVMIVLSSCDDDDEIKSFGGGPIPHFTSASFNYIVSPGDTEGYNIQVGTTTAEAQTVNIVIDESSTAIEGVHFESIQKSIAIGQGQYVANLNVKPILDALDGSYKLKLRVEGATEGLNTSFTLTLNRFCPLEITEWVGTYDCLEPGYATYDVAFVLGAAENTIVTDNFWDFGGVVTYTLSESSNPDEAIVTIEEQIANMGGTDYIVKGSGIYEQCSRMMVVDYQVIRASDELLRDDNTHTYTLK